MRGPPTVALEYVRRRILSQFYEPALLVNPSLGASPSRTTSLMRATLSFFRELESAFFQVTQLKQTTCVSLSSSRGLQKKQKILKDLKL